MGETGAMGESGACIADGSRPASSSLVRRPSAASLRPGADVKSWKLALALVRRSRFVAALTVERPRSCRR